MGGGTRFGGDDVRRTGRGDTVSKETQKEMTRRSMDPVVDPTNRILTCTAGSPIAFSFDQTGSMGNLPQIIRDKYPLLAGQIETLRLLDDPMMSVCAIGDAETGELAPIQVGDFLRLRDVGDGFRRIFLVGQGGPSDRESYELMMYYFAYMCDLPNAQMPFFLMTGDEGFRDSIPATRLKQVFGSTAKQHKTTSVETVYAALDAKFKGNCFLIKRVYSGATEAEIMRSWSNLMGRGRIAVLGSSTDGDKSIGDVAIGVIALATGRMSLDEYCLSMVEAREEPQTQGRIELVRRSLEPVAEFCAGRLLPTDERVTPEEMEYAKRIAIFGTPDKNIKPPRRGQKSKTISAAKDDGSASASKNEKVGGSKKPDKKSKKGYQL
jgi:hypothetical protein